MLYHNISYLICSGFEEKVWAWSKIYFWKKCGQVLKVLFPDFKPRASSQKQPLIKSMQGQGRKDRGGSKIF